LLARLRLEQGDALSINETPDGLHFCNWMLGN
jgi:hypothetical protein